MKKRKHRNKLSRLTAKERATELVRQFGLDGSRGHIADAERALQAHAREAVARYKRKHMMVWDHMIATAKGSE